jgi:hypothetical protein
MVYSNKIFAERLAFIFLCAVFCAVCVSTVFSQTKSTNHGQKSAPSKNKMNELPTGEWAGKHIAANFTDEGATLEFDCASGAINRKIVVDQKNRFEAAGTYAEEGGGPVRFESGQVGVAVKYTGQISGKKMSLVVRREDSGKLIGRFALFYGQESTLVKCR